MYTFLSGYQNLLHYQRMYPDVRKERIAEVTKLVRLEKRINDKVKTYSLGMKQRLCLAQALLNHPALLILDEPTNGLDPTGIHDLRNHLRELAVKQNIAVFVSSHLLSEMQLMCDRVGIIQNGKLVKIQNVKELIEGTSLEEEFLKMTGGAKLTNIINLIKNENMKLSSRKSTWIMIGILIIIIGTVGLISKSSDFQITQSNWEEVLTQQIDSRGSNS